MHNLPMDPIAEDAACDGIGTLSDSSSTCSAGFPELPAPGSLAASSLQAKERRQEYFTLDILRDDDEASEYSDSGDEGAVRNGGDGGVPAGGSGSGALDEDEERLRRLMARHGVSVVGEEAAPVMARLAPAAAAPLNAEAEGSASADIPFCDLAYLAASGVDLRAGYFASQAGRFAAQAALVSSRGGVPTQRLRSTASPVSGEEESGCASSDSGGEEEEDGAPAARSREGAPGEEARRLLYDPNADEEDAAWARARALGRLSQGRVHPRGLEAAAAGAISVGGRSVPLTVSASEEGGAAGRSAPPSMSVCEEGSTLPPQYHPGAPSFHPGGASEADGARLGGESAHARRGGGSAPGSASGALSARAPLTDPRALPLRSDAVLSCPACFSVVCVTCQAHARFPGQFRALEGVNVRIDRGTTLESAPEEEEAAGKTGDCTPPQALHPLLCATCETEVGVAEAGPGALLHFFGVLAGEG